MRWLWQAVTPLLAVGVGLPGPASTRDLSFEERISAQLAIERVYRSHQEGESTSAQEPVSRGVLERTVKQYLGQTAILDSFWKTPVPADALRNEMDRIARDTRFPDRLRQIYAALGNDAFVVQECFARATLVDRWSRGLFAFDRRIHARARGEAERLRSDLAEGVLDPFREEAHRELIEISLRPAESRASGPEIEIPPAGTAGPVRLNLSRREFDASRARAPERTGEIGPVVEEADAFLIRVVLSEQSGRALIARYTVPKRSWDDWWAEVEGDLDMGRVKATAASAEGLPAPGSSMSTVGWSAAGASSSSVDKQQMSGGSSCSPTNSWDNGILGAVPEGRTTATAVWTGRVMVVWGGSRDGRLLQTGGRYDPVTDSWTPTSMVNAPEARSAHTAVWTGSEMIVWGGFAGSLGDVATGSRYDPVADTWTPTSTSSSPIGRESHTAVWTGNRMVVWGGTGSDISGTHYLDTGGRYDPVANTWVPTSTIGAASGRRNHSAVWTGSRMLVWGGVWSDGTNTYTLNTGGRYDPVADTWSPTAALGAPAVRGYHTAVWTGSRMIVWGGQDFPAPGQRVYLQTGGLYDPLSDTWAPTSLAAAPTARISHTAVWTGSAMIVWGGQGSSPNGPDGTGARYDPSTNGWTPTTDVAAPQARSGHVAVWTGAQMVLWGGSVSGGVSPDSGGRYDPAMDRWAPTFSQNSPDPRESPSVIWTGNLMIVWGGLRGEEPVGTGGRYDPLTDSWSPTSTVGVYRARIFHTAVWTGSQMIVWGGEPCPNIYDKGQSYDPLADAWTNIDYLTEPAPRRHHTAIWTGNRMVVWGGLACSSPPVPVATGARYDPVANTWTPTSTGSAPVARQYHTAVWTGSGMVVWGGSDESPSPTYFDTGALYDPSGDSWAAVAKGGAPSPRKDHTAVWTGSAMLIWGGTGSADFNTGGRYDVATNHWSTMTTSGAPSPRIGHTAVWAGNRMVIWGGETSQPGLDRMNTGGRYDPAADSWASTTTMGAPSARTNHIAAWTGTFMIVWGGVGDFLPGTGGRYVVNNPDSDNDGAADVCDCAPLNPGVFAVPHEVTGLVVDPDKTTIRWDSAAPGAGAATVHDALRGGLDSLPVGGPGEYCLPPGASQTSREDPSIPLPGTGFWYIARGRNSCGAGTYGYTSDGAERLSSTCP